MTLATADSQGDEKKAKALYIKYRAKQIYKEIASSLRERAKEEEKRQRSERSTAEKVVTALIAVFLCAIFLGLIHLLTSLFK
jgi:uncharacterized oligopeptide transporter (OPT) family protein